MRTIIDIPSAQLAQLDDWAENQKISRAQAVRLALTALLERVNTPKHTGFGIWVQSGAVPAERDGLVLQQSMRDEWPE
jgi:hypothetical protein